MIFSLQSIISYLSDQLFALLKSWPFVLLLIAWLFRMEIKRLFLRIESAEIGSTRITLKQGSLDTNGLVTRSQISTKETTSKNNEKIKLPPFPPGDFKAVMDEREQELKKWINNFPYKETDFIIRELASFQLAVEYERLYQLIFKSQIDLLQRLRGAKDGINRDMLLENYNELEKKYPRSYFNYSFDNWIAFLTSNSLVIEENSFLKITDNGRAFLTYIIYQRGYDITLKTL